MIKRIFDVVFSFLAILFLGWLILLAYLLACIDTRSNGFFLQKRVGQYGRLFTIYKLKTISPSSGKISALGRFFRNSKIDELPQLLNVLKGEMSFVGPRPDIEGYYDQLSGEDRKLLDLKPGITSEASLKYAGEEKILSLQENPLKYNDEVIFPDKVKMNLHYYEQRSFWGDLHIILKTLF